MTMMTYAVLTRLEHIYCTRNALLLHALFRAVKRQRSSQPCTVLGQRCTEVRTFVRLSDVAQSADAFPFMNHGNRWFGVTIIIVISWRLLCIISVTYG